MKYEHCSKYVENGLKLAQQFFGRKENWNLYTHQISIYGSRVMEYIEIGDRVLDVGHGYCGLTFACLNMHCYTDAIDLFTEHPPIPEVHWYTSNIEDPDCFLKKNFYDAIIFTEILEHLNFTPQNTIDRLFDSLKVGGYMIVTTPTKGIYPDPEVEHVFEDWNPEVTPIDQHMRIYSDDDVIDMLSKRGTIIRHDHLCNHSFFVSEKDL